MKTRITTAVAGLALLGLSALLTATSASAGSYGHSYYRVVEVAGSQTLDLRSGPSARADIIVELPFDARGLRPTGVREPGWIQLTFVTDTHEEFTGWVRSTDVIADDGYAPTVYRIVDVGSYGATVQSDAGWGDDLGTIPAGARGVLAVGECDQGYCPVRYVGKKRRLEGWVSAANLAVAGNPRMIDDEDTADLSPPAARVVPSYAPRFGRSDRETIAAMRDAAGTARYLTPRKRGFWWGVTHPREAWGR